jgi:hypothetical protein
MCASCFISKIHASSNPCSEQVFLIKVLRPVSHRAAYSIDHYPGNPDQGSSETKTGSQWITVKVR